MAERQRRRPRPHQAGRLGRVQRHRPTDVPRGTPEDRAGTLGLVIGEFGWQVDIGPALEARYNGKENVPTVTEAVQADYYAEVIGTFACDPAVTDALLLHLVDDPDLGRFQTGLLRLDGSERPSYAAVQKAIAAARNCNAEAKWSHATGVVGAKAIFGARDHPATKAIFGISTRAQEEAGAKAGMFRGRPEKPGRDEVALARPRDAPQWRGADDDEARQGGHKPRPEFHGQLNPGYYVYGLRLTASMNRNRSRTFVSKVFRIEQAVESPVRLRDGLSTG